MFRNGGPAERPAGRGHASERSFYPRATRMYRVHTQSLPYLLLRPKQKLEPQLIFASTNKRAGTTAGFCYNCIAFLLQPVFWKATIDAAKSFNQRRQMLEPTTATIKGYIRHRTKLQSALKKASNAEMPMLGVGYCQQGKSFKVSQKASTVDNKASTVADFCYHRQSFLLHPSGGAATSRRRRRFAATIIGFCYYRWSFLLLFSGLQCLIGSFFFSNG